MSETVISLDEAARDFSALVARTCDRHESLLITDGGRPVARLSPIDEPARTCAELAERIKRQPRLSPENADSLERELAESRALLSPLRSKWD